MTRATRPLRWLKTAWLLCVLTTTFLRLPFLIAYYAFRSLRQHHSWTLRQAICTDLMKRYLHHLTVLELGEILSLAPKREGERFVRIDPVSEESVTSPLKDPGVHPIQTGGTWFPSKPDSARLDKEKVILHLHGGGFVLGDGREQSMGTPVKTLMKHVNAKVFSLQYRISADPDCPFPAALQDAFAAYRYLLNHGIASDRIVLSGDSAGGNLALALLRYLSEEQDEVPQPAATLLFSPWLDLKAALSLKPSETHRNAAADYLTPIMLRWGAKAYSPRITDADHAYISPIGHPFKCGVPLFIHVCGLEIFRDDIIGFARAMEALSGNTVMLYEEPLAPHDMILFGHVLGFAREAARAAEKAGEMLEEYVSADWRRGQ